MKSKFNPSTNELVDSVFFNENNTKTLNRTVERSNDRANVRDIETTKEIVIEEPKQVSNADSIEAEIEEPIEPSLERYGVRESFEIYKDQQDSLDNLIRYRWQKEHKRPIKSAMIREALDTYLKKEYKRLGLKP